MRFSKESPIPNSPRIDAAMPDAALPGGEVEVRGTQLGAVRSRLPVAVLDGIQAPVLLSRSNRMIVRIPEDVQSGRLEIRQNGQSSNTVRLKIARPVTGNLHPVGNPAVDAEGNIYSPDSGPRGQKTAVSVYRITPSGEMQPLVSGITNATGLALDSHGYLYVSSRLDGTVHRVSPQGASSVYAEGMGIATGIAFDIAGNLYVGDRSGTIFKIARDRQTFVFATLEPSAAAYHLAFGPQGDLFVSAPSTSFDSIYKVDPHGTLSVFYRGLGRAQGLALDVEGNVYVAASLAGKRGIVKITPQGKASLEVSGQGLVGLAFAQGKSAILATSSPGQPPNGAIHHISWNIQGLPLTAQSFIL